MIILSVISLAKGSINAMKFPGGSIDFHYPLYVSMIARINPYGEETLTLHKELSLDVYYPGGYGPHNANHLPSAVVFLLPLAYLKPYTANFVWLVCNILFSFAIVMLVKYLFFDKLYVGTNNTLIYIIFAAVFLAGTPLRNSIGNGQNNIISFFFLLLSLWLSEKDHRVLAGISLSATLFKYTLTVPLFLYYIYKRKYKEIIIAAIIHILLTLFASVWLGASPVELIIMSLRVSSNLSAQGMYDICSVFTIQGITVSAMLFIIMAAFVYYCSVKLPGHDNDVIAMLAVFALIFVYHRIYDYFVLIVPLIVVMTSDKYYILDKIITCLSVAHIFFFQRIAMSLCSESVYMTLHYTFAVVFYLMFFCLIYRLAKNMQLW